MAAKRLGKELKMLMADPLEGASAKPAEGGDLMKWHGAVSGEVCAFPT